MLLSTLILINIGFIAYFGTLFLRLHEDVRLMNDDIENLKAEFKQVVERAELEKAKALKPKEGEEFLGIWLKKYLAKNI